MVKPNQATLERQKNGIFHVNDRVWIAKPIHWDYPLGPLPATVISRSDRDVTVRYDYGQTERMLINIYKVGRIIFSTEEEARLASNKWLAEHRKWIEAGELVDG